MEEERSDREKKKRKKAEKKWKGEEKIAFQQYRKIVNFESVGFFTTGPGL